MQTVDDGAQLESAEVGKDTEILESDWKEQAASREVAGCYTSNCLIESAKQQLRIASWQGQILERRCRGSVGCARKSTCGPRKRDFSAEVMAGV